MSNFLFCLGFVLVSALLCSSNRGIKDICVSFDEVESGKYFTDEGLKVDVLEENFSTNITVEFTTKTNKKSEKQRAFYIEQSNNDEMNPEALIVCDSEGKMTVGSVSGGSRQPLISMLSGLSHCNTNVNYTMAVYMEKRGEVKRVRLQCPKRIAHFGRPCVDRFSGCPRWKLKQCWGSFSSWMRFNCPESCKLCVPEKTGDCFDDQRYRRSCVLWKDQNLCSVGKWTAFVQEKCPASCKVCQ